MIIEEFIDFIAWFSNLLLFAAWIGYKRKFAPILANGATLIMSTYVLDYSLNLEWFESIERHLIPFRMLFWAASGWAITF